MGALNWGVTLLNHDTQYLYLGLKTAWQRVPYLGDCLLVNDMIEIQINHHMDAAAEKLNTRNRNENCKTSCILHTYLHAGGTWQKVENP